MADARFTINDDTSDQGYDAAALDVLILRLKTQPPSGVQSVRFQVWDAAAFDPDEDPVSNPPRKSKGAPDLVLVGTTSGPSVSPASIDGTVTVTLPNAERVGWIVRCVVNGGMGTLPDGRVGFDGTLVHERMIVIRDALGARPIIATETTQYETDGWAGEFSVIEGPAGATGATGPAGATGPTGADGTSAPFSTVDATLAIVGTELRRAAVTGHISIPAGSVDARTVLIPPAALVTDVKAAVPFMVHRRLTMAGGAGSSTSILTSEAGFLTGFPFSARLLDAWIHCTLAQSSSSVQVFKNSTAGGNELTSVLSTAAQGVIRNADNQSRTIDASDAIIVRKNGAAFLGVQFEVTLVFIPVA